MLKRFRGGLIFGAGFAIAFLTILAATLYFGFPALVENRIAALEHSDGCGGSFTVGPGAEIDAPPSITNADRFLGVSGSYGNGFKHGANPVLAAGPGRIIGRVRVNGKPLKGLKLRLALNGSAKSQWAVSGPDGRYEIAVPYGEYRIDGYILDTGSADSVLAGKIGYPRNPYSSGTSEIAEGAPGDGLTLDFVDPVVLDLPKRKFSAGENVVIRWESYPGATEYTVQLWEQASADNYAERKLVFPWSERPVVHEPTVNLADYGVDLKAGHYYSVDVMAQTGAWQPLSQTPRRFREYDFKVVAPGDGGD